MGKKFKCPMMYGIPNMYQPESMYMEPEIQTIEDLEMDNYYEDEEDDRHFMKMYPEVCKKITIYVNVEIDTMEEKDEKMHDYRPNREMINMMVENA